MSKFDDMMDYQKNRQRFLDLKQNIDSIVPFVGAGLSAPYGFPQWKEFLLNCCIDMPMTNEVNRILNSDDPSRYELAASYLSQQLNRSNPYYFHKQIQEIFNKTIPSVPNSPIQLFSTLFSGPIITTNFDRVLENVTGYETVLPSQRDKLSCILKNSNFKAILKLHGDINDIDHIILTKEQYDNSYFKDANFQKNFSQLLTSKIFLFLGCSLENDRTMEFMARAESLESTRFVDNYAFMASPAFSLKEIKNKTKEQEELAQQKEQEIENRLRKVNILPIWFPEGKFDWIFDYLNLLYKQDYFELFQTHLETPLFLEDNYERKITLKDIYVEPEFVFLREDIPQEYLFKLIYDFMDDRLSNDIKVKRKTKDPNHILNTLFILGEPGIGKSSLVSKIVVDRKRKNKFYCLRLRDLDKSKIAIEGALHAILHLLKIETSDLVQKTLILDGVDELCGIENYMDSIDNLCFTLMEETKQWNFKLLFTSRLNYVNLKDTRFNTMLVIQLLPFQEKQFTSWFINYHKIHSQTEQTINLQNDILALCKTEEEEEKKKLELFGIPLVLYLLAELKVNISDISSIGQLYDKLFEELERRFYDDKTTYTIPTPYRNCKEIARHIAKKMFDTHNDMLTSEEYNEVVLSLPETLKNGLEDMTDKEHFYLLSFYYRITNKEKRSVEFIHKSLMEYLIGELLYCCISKILDISEEEEQKKQLQKKLDNFFTFSAITDEIGHFFLYNARKNKKQQQLFQLLKKYYKFYLEIGFLYEISNTTNSLDKIQNLFSSYWKLLRILANSKKDNLLDEEKNLFCNYLTKFQFRNLDLSYQNLTKCNLNNSFLVQANLQGAYLQGAYLKGAYLQGAYLKGADLQGANLQGADLKETNLQVANLQGAYLQVAYLQGADLQGAYLKGANLQGADLQVAYLKGAYLKGAYLQGAYLQEAKLPLLDLIKAILGKAHLPASLILRRIVIPIIIILCFISLLLYLLFFK